MGFKIWLPISDRSRVCSFWKPKQKSTLLSKLPLLPALNEASIRTVKNIDVIWAEKRTGVLTIARAFEVEDTTAIYSGILRMADLLALVPDIDIKLHIVAPAERREAVLTQIMRPAFSNIGRKQLRDVCSYISYESIEKLAEKGDGTTETDVEGFCEFAGK